jgi:hypothetical protein
MINFRGSTTATKSLFDPNLHMVDYNDSGSQKVSATMVTMTRFVHDQINSIVERTLAIFGEMVDPNGQ